MINTKELKLSKQIVVILLIAVFSIFGFISCMGGDDILGSGGRSYSGVDVNDTSDGGNDPSSPDYKPNLPDDNPSDYYRIRVPFGVGGDGYTNVSYKDTNKLKQLWFDQINRKAINDGRVFAIRNRANNRDANNFQSRHTHGQYSAQDYYYFNENGDIVYKEDNTIIKKFIGAIITEYRNVSLERGHRANFGFNDNRQAIVNISWTLKGDFTVGAVYANALTTEQARAKYMGDNPFKDGVFDFITYWHHVETFHSGVAYANNVFERQYINPGFLEVFVMCDYYYSLESGEAAVHSYYPYYGIYNYYKEYVNHPGIYFTPENMPYMTNEKVYLAQRPDFTTKQLNHTAEFTDKHRGWEFMFMPAQKDVDSVAARTTRVNKRIK